MRVGTYRLDRSLFRLAIASATAVSVAWLVDSSLGDGAGTPPLVAGTWMVLVAFLLPLVAERVED